MYEDLNTIAQLKFNKEMESISRQTREKVKERQNEYAALSGSFGGRSGQQDASICQIQINGAERLVRAFFQIWIELIKQRKGYISRPDVTFISSKIDSYSRIQFGHLRAVFLEQRIGAVVNLMTEEADLKMQATASDLRRDLEIMVRENEAFPNMTISEKHHLSSKETTGVQTSRHSAIVLNILIASPSDVENERELVTRAIYEWNATHFAATGIMLNPIKWESHSYPASGDRPQAILNRQIVESGDILIGIFGDKLGTPTGVAQSGTIEEIEEFRKAGKYIALYFSTSDVPRNADRNQLALLEAYKKERQQDTLYADFRDNQNLRDNLVKHLPKIVQAVAANLQVFSSSQASEGRPSNLHGEAVHATPKSTLLADLISELEDNFDCASRPQTGNIYRRPTNRVWIENRNKITLPPELFLQVKNTYNRIGAWADIVSSGLTPSIGSLELNTIAVDLRHSLPSLIGSLQKSNSAPLI